MPRKPVREEPHLDLPKGPNRREREILDLYDAVEGKLLSLPVGVPWRQVTVARTSAGIYDVRVVV